MGESLSTRVQEPGLTWSLSCISYNSRPPLVCLWLCLLLMFKCVLSCWFLGEPQQCQEKLKMGCEMVGKSGERGVGCPEC